jgi:Flp pilus assembly protein TadG
VNLPSDPSILPVGLIRNIAEPKSVILGNKVKGGRRNSQRGNMFLESALVFGPLFMLLFAIIDFSMALLVKNTIQTAVR